MNDSKYFSQRAKYICSLKEQLSTVQKNTMKIYFPFSNRTYIPMIESDHRQNISLGRGRTTVPLSAFVLQKQAIDPPKKSKSTPSFVMHDEVQFVRPYFGPKTSTNQSQSSTISKREVLLSALEQIESGLKIL